MSINHTRIVTFIVTAGVIVLGLPAASTAQSDHSQHDHAQMHARGGAAMGFDQEATTHHFFLFADGGAIQVTVNDAGDRRNLEAIQAHLPHIAVRFAAGDFGTPKEVHARQVPGSAVMAARREAIRYRYEPLPGGGRVRILSDDPQALAAIHEFLRFQIADHRTGDTTAITTPSPAGRPGGGH